MIVEVSTTAQPGAGTDADTVAVGVFEGEDPPADTPAELAGLLASGEARSSYKALGLTHAQDKRWLVVGLGKREQFTPERARALAATVHARALELGARTLCVQTPPQIGGEIAAALTEGTVLADYRFEMHKSTPEESGGTGEEEAPPKHLERLIVSAPGNAGGEDEGKLETFVRDAALVAAAANAARDLQNRPANDLTPTALAEYAIELGSTIESLSVEVEGRAGIPRGGWARSRPSRRAPRRSRR